MQRGGNPCRDSRREAWSTRPDWRRDAIRSQFHRDKYSDADGRAPRHFGDCFGGLMEDVQKFNAFLIEILLFIWVDADD